MNQATTDQGCDNLRWALALLDGLVAGGMRRLVLSPGSRSTPLVLAGQRQPALELTPILDERSAAFFALGLARASGHPVGLVCTSGSALAHWFPAVIEASESEIPLLLLSADRPPELRGWGANQTIDQIRLFGGYVREFHDPGPAEASPRSLKMIRALGARAAAVSQGQRPGPVHLNLPFREPLVPSPECLADPSLWPQHDAPAADADAPTESQSLGRWSGRDGIPTQSVGTSTGADESISPSPCREMPVLSDAEGVWGEGLIVRTRDLAGLMSGHGLICCGPGNWSGDAAAALWGCARQLELPVLCDPLSGLRFGPDGAHRITRYDSLLRHPETAAALKPDWVLRFGRAPVSKTLLGWLADIPTILVDPGPGWSDPSHDVRLRIATAPQRFCEWLQHADLDRISTARTNLDWIGQWTAAERHLDHLVADYLDQAPWCEAHLLGDLLAALPEGEGLLCANSLPIRQLDTWSGSRTAWLQVFGNRGASGIDGQTSTLAGLNAGGVPTTGLLGDLSFLHDLSGLLLMSRLDRPCLVLNNGGGRIFDYLPQQGLPGFERLWRTPVAIDLNTLLRPFGITHREVNDGAGFREALAEAIASGRRQGQAGVIEVRIDAEISREVHQTFWRSIREASISMT